MGAPHCRKARGEAEKPEGHGRLWMALTTGSMDQAGTRCCRGARSILGEQRGLRRKSRLQGSQKVNLPAAHYAQPGYRETAFSKEVVLVSRMKGWGLGGNPETATREGGE
ncbi:hypothetical protein WMY93_005262 [Mugilogobius chulae]|uniref:Uncharacterized protein n=1 Tax=Mugilogobius chulae TaxID=88201 RepID=A0AAW0PUD5_9GOBI